MAQLQTFVCSPAETSSGMDHARDLPDSSLPHICCTPSLRFECAAPILSELFIKADRPLQKMSSGSTGTAVVLRAVPSWSTHIASDREHHYLLSRWDPSTHPASGLASQ